jgi:hypothetical protein
MKLICWPALAKFYLMPSQAMSCLTYSHIRDMLAFAGYLKVLLCLLCLHRHFASWAMSHRHRLLWQCRNTALPSLAISILYLLSYLPLGLLCLLDYFCLLGYFASWATFASWACLLSYFASWAALPLGLYIDTLPLRLCLIDIVCFDNAGILICLLGCFASWATLPLGLFQHVIIWAMSHRHCLLWQFRYTDMPLGLCQHWALVQYAKMIRHVNMLNRDTLWNRIWQKIWYLLALRSMSRYITEPELAITERIIECRDMLACRNKRRYELLIGALICWRTEINGDWGFWSMPWYVGILKFCSCHDMLAYWNFALAMICRHTKILLLPWYAGILKYLWLKISLNNLMC